jgi:hypothetical protein
MEQEPGNGQSEKLRQNLLLLNVGKRTRERFLESFKVDGDQLIPETLTEVILTDILKEGARCRLVYSENRNKLEKELEWAKSQE